MSTIEIENKKYNILYTYEKDGKTYIVYTDNEENNDGFIKAYAGIYDERSKKIIPIKDDEESEKINTILDKLTKER